MSYPAHFHGGPRNNTTCEVDDVQADVYVGADELEDGGAVDVPAVREGEPIPTLPNSHYRLREGSVADGLHYDWQP
jgi:hypothetical protein